MERVTSLALLALFLTQSTFCHETYDDAIKAGQERVQAKDYAAARRDFLIALDMAQRDYQVAHAYVSVAQTYLAEREYAIARDFYEKILLVEDPGPSPVYGRRIALAMIAETYAKEEKYALALEAYERLAAVDPERAMMRRDRFDAAVARAKKGLERQLLNTKGHPFYKSRAQFQAGFDLLNVARDYEAARKAFQETVTITNGHPDYRANAQFLVGYVDFVRQDYPAARKEFAKVAAIRDASTIFAAEAQYYTGYSYYNEKSYAAAKDSFLKVAPFEKDQGRHYTYGHKLMEVKKRSKEYLTKLDKLLKNLGAK